MKDRPRQILSQIIIRHGTDICDAPRRLEAMLRDLCGAHRREINIIMGALEERVAADLMAAGNTVPREVLFARLAARLRDNLAYTPEAARWVVETWALALGLLSEAEFLERMGKEAAAANQNSAPVRDAESSGANPASENLQAPQHTSTPAPPRQPPQPPSVQFPAPAPSRRPAPPASINTPEPPQQDLSPSPPLRQTLRRGLTMRSCVTIVVLVIVLIIAAVFVVPAVILLLREEQATPSINEPRAR